MRNVVKYIMQAGLVVCLMLFFLVGCDKENDFYEVGRQPVFLTSPENGAIWTLNYQKPDSMYLFSWESKRQFIYFNLVIGLDNEFAGKKVEVSTGIKRDFYLSTMKVDSILSSMDIGIGETTNVYWTVNVVDPETGWCEGVHKLTITRCNLPTNVILLNQPEATGEVILDKENPEGEVTFSWSCKTHVNDYVLHISTNESFEDELQIECGNGQSYSFTNQYLDEWLQEQKVDLGKSTLLYWKVTGTGNLNNPIENSAVREISMTRFIREPAKVTLLSPENESTVFLESEHAEDLFEFKWKCDTTGVSFKIKLYDAEFDIVEVFDAGEKTSFSMQQQDLDMLLNLNFGMVASQKKKLYWEVIPNDPLRAVAEEKGEFIIRRFASAVQAQPISLINFPVDATSYVLSYQTPDDILTNVTWDCNVRNVTYAIEYSLNQDMSQSKIKALSISKSVDFTHSLLDELLSELNASYLTRTVYWRITSTVDVMTEASDIHSLVLTGMMKPLVDLRDAAKPETYPVVKIGNSLWIAENLRATCYSDGTEFTTIDLPSRTYTDGAVSDPEVIGQYYTWPTALRDWQRATTSEDTKIQGVCPNGWHISTMSEWKELLNTYPAEPSIHLKSTQYWNNLSDITNDSGLSLVPAGQFWHGNVPTPDLGGGDGKAGYWTTTIGSETTAYMYEVFDWSRDVTPWHYLSRPWVEGDGTASKMVNVRCVRTLE